MKTVTYENGVIQLHLTSDEYDRLQAVLEYRAVYGEPVPRVALVSTRSANCWGIHEGRACSCGRHA